MPSDPIEAGRKGGRSKSGKKVAAAKRNGFQRRYDKQGSLLPLTGPSETQQNATEQEGTHE